MKPFKLQLGPRDVCVTNDGEGMDSNQWGLARYAASQILLSPDLKPPGDQFMMTLWHEVIHFIDKDQLGERLREEGDTDEEHPLLDMLASAIHAALKRNWHVWRQMYDANAKG